MSTPRPGRLTYPEQTLATLRELGNQMAALRDQVLMLSVKIDAAMARAGVAIPTAAASGPPAPLAGSPAVPLPAQAADTGKEHAKP